MTFKQFSQEDNDRYDLPAKRAVACWLAWRYGIEAAEYEDYKVDLILRLNGSLHAFMEVEVRNWLGHKNLCPFQTIHVGLRKAKLLDNTAPTYFAAVTNDFKHAYICDAKDIVASPVKEISNIHVTQGEYFYDVPIDKFKLVNLELPF
jgi:hypothetical protein